MNASKPPKGINMTQVQDSNYRNRDFDRSYVDLSEDGGGNEGLIDDGRPANFDTQPTIYSPSSFGDNNLYDQSVENYSPSYSGDNDQYGQSVENYSPAYSGKSNLDDPGIKVDPSYSDQTNQYDRDAGSKPPVSPNAPHFKDSVKQEALALDIMKNLGYKSPTFDPSSETKFGAKELGLFADTIYILSGEVPSDQKNKATFDFAKGVGSDTFSFAMKQMEKDDLFGIGGKMKSAYGYIGALPGIVDSAIKLYDGVAAGNPYKATAGAIGVASGIVGVAAPTSLAGSFLGGAAVVAEGLDQAHSFATDTNTFNQKTILNKEENQRYDYVWTAKGNQNGTTSSGVNTLSLGAHGRPMSAMVDTPNNGAVPPFTVTDVFRYKNLSPSDTGAVNNDSYDSNPKENRTGFTSYGNGFVGFKTSNYDKPGSGEELRPANNLIYTSNNSLTNVMGSDNKSVDDINPDGTGLPGNDKIISTSGAGTKINAGAGDDFVSITGKEAKVDGGPGFDQLEVRNDGGNTLVMHGNHGLLNGTVEVDNFEVFKFHGQGNHVYLDMPKPGELPVFVLTDTQGDNTIELKPQTPQDVDRNVTQERDRMRTEGEVGHRTYTPLLDQTTINGRAVAETLNFTVHRT
ncbi:hypothetical protein [Caballeronia sp. KNU42]